MWKRLFLDAETYSTVPIRHGTYAYAEGAEIMLLAWALDDGLARVWDRTQGEPMPEPLMRALSDGSVQIVAHNASFDRTLLRLCGEPLERQAAEAIARWRCTRVQAYTHGLVGALDALCGILGVPQTEAKGKDGRRLVRLFCLPQKDGSRNTAATHQEDWAKFVAYAARDIDAMRAVAERSPEWNYRGAELALWHLDQRINDRGFAVDVDLANAALAAVAAEQKRLAKRTWELTDGEVDSALRRDLLLTHLLIERGVNLPDMTAATLERRIADDDLPPELRELLAVRLQSSTSSTAKYAALLRNVSSDGRLRGTLQFSGAPRTRRWSHKGFQPGNLPRPSMSASDIDDGIDAMKAGCADLIYG